MPRHPCLYYGCEQALHDDTKGGNDPYNRPMMAAFDTDSALYQAVKKLAHVRKQNIAVQFGSSWTKYLTPNVLCYSRHYRDGEALVLSFDGSPSRGEAGPCSSG